MRMIVCVKAVRSDLVGTRGQDEPFVVNPYDLYAVQQCLAFKNRHDACRLTALCLGPAAAQPALTKLLAMGIDEAALVSDPIYAGSDTVATSYILSRAIEKLGQFDVIACGRKAIDGETGQTVYGLGQRLGLYVVDNAQELLHSDMQGLTLIQKLDDGTRTIRIKRPVIVSFCDFSLKYQTISLMALKRAKREEIPVLSNKELGCEAARCGFKGSRTKVSEVEQMLCKKAHTTISGSAAQKAKALCGIIAGGERFEVAS